MPQTPENQHPIIEAKNGLLQEDQVRQMPRRLQRLPDDVNVQHPSDLHDLQGKGTAESRLPQGGRGRPRGNPQGKLQLPRHRPGRLNANTGAVTPPTTERKTPWQRLLNHFVNPCSQVLLGFFLLHFSKKVCHCLLQRHRSRTLRKGLETRYCLSK